VFRSGADIPTMQNVGARLLMVLAFVAAAVSYNAWVFTHTVLDPNATRGAAHTLLAAPAVQRSISDNLTKAVDDALEEQHADPQVARAVRKALRDPRVKKEFEDAFVELHRALISGGDTTVTIDSKMLTTKVRDALQKIDPNLAAQLDAQQQPLRVDVGGKDMPHAGNVRHKASLYSLVAFLLALLFGGLSLRLLHDRRSIGRVGRRIAYLSFTPLVLFVVAPHFLSESKNDGMQVAGAVLQAYRGRALPSAIGLIALGATVSLVALAWPRRRVDEPLPVGSAPTYDPRAMAPRLPTVPMAPAITDDLYL
jgi:hypothetical protein